MTFAQSIASGFANYANFTGRATRSEFWNWVAACFVFGLAGCAVDALLLLQLVGNEFILFFSPADVIVGSAQISLLPMAPALAAGADLAAYLIGDRSRTQLLHLLDPSYLGLAGEVVAVVLVTPSTAVAARRLHDGGKSGWWQSLAYTPFILGLATVGMILGPLSAVALAMISLGPIPEGPLSDWLSVTLTFAFAAIALSWALVLYWFARRGTLGPNRFGAPLITPP
ncbi:MAG: DUF805 domain-containing protein [Bauldia sp.]